MPPLSTNDKKVQQAKKVIRSFRSNEQEIRDLGSSRSTGIRNVYKGGYEALAKVEEILAAK